MPPPYVFRIAQVAERWGVSPRHVSTLIAQGHLGHLRIGTLIRVRHVDVEEYETRQFQPPTAVNPPTVVIVPPTNFDPQLRLSSRMTPAERGRVFALRAQAKNRGD